MSDLIFSATGASLRTAGQTVFSDINFEIRAGAHWAFTGENDIFKTAFLEALAGTRPFIKGLVRYPFLEAAGRSSGPLLSPRKFIQAVSFRHPCRNLSNTTSFYYQQRFNAADADNALTVAAYLAAAPSNVPNGVWTFEKVVAELKLQPLLDETLIKLSNGETKRVLLAAALLRNPVLLLLNNPFAGLDTAARSAIAHLLKTIAACGTALVLATSATQIPDVMTHVAHFGNAGKIACFRKQDYPWNQAPAPQHEIDLAELNALPALHPPAAYNDIVRMKAVSIRYGNNTILNNINWTVKQGERWALRGPNGSGKSTLLSLINGDNPQAFANDIVLFDRRKGSGESIWDIKKKIGFFSPELYQYFPVETACLHAVESGFYDTIGLFRPSKAATAGLARRWMKLLGIDMLATKALRQVSPAQQRWCLLARALVKSPPLLLLDEPGQGFNEAEQARLKHLINAVCEQCNTTLIYVSHYDDELPDCITKTILLSNGNQVTA